MDKNNENAAELGKAIYNGEVPPLPTYDVYRSSNDGVIVVHVQTDEIPENENGPMIRVYLNDEVIFENPGFQEHNLCRVIY